MKQGKTCCFTGRRAKYLFGYDKASYGPLLQQIKDCVLSLYKLGYRNFITGGAQGFDQLAFWAVDSAKKQYPDIQNIVYIPFQGQELRWAPDGVFGQNEYNQMLQCADEIKIISDQANKAALFMRNEAMIDASDGIICLYEDDTWKDSKTAGGTAASMRYAMQHMIDIWQIVFNLHQVAPYPVKVLQRNIFA